MSKHVKKEVQWGDKLVSIETGKMAVLADAAVVVSCGGTSVLCSVVGKKKPNENADFFPLSVFYREMMFAAGKIPGGFFKREGRPSEREVITSRLIDRPIRPLFPDRFFHEVQIICTLISYDGENDSDILAIIGASTALSLSGIPFMGPIAATRVCMINGEFVANPSVKEYANSKLDLVVAGTKESILMVEAEAHQLSEDQMLEALELAHKSIQPILKTIQELVKEAGKNQWIVDAPKDNKDLVAKVTKFSETLLEKAYKGKGKHDRNDAIAKIQENLLAEFDLDKVHQGDVVSAFKSLQERMIRENLIKGVRIDGRDADAIRKISTEVSILDRTHGSALFTRGETQALVVATLGSTTHEQKIDSLDGEYNERFMLHYNFPPYSVGEVGRMQGAGRREIGHGRLAWRAIRSLLPAKEAFPYAIRVVSEVTQCNGSSSMATICGASLALMDAGVPLSMPIAGIAMGLVMEGKKHIILSDIIADEDFCGDMDLKVAGTSNGITALQMDIKVHGITIAIMKEALTQAKTGRLFILDEMKNSLKAPREALSQYAPVVNTLKIDKEKIGALIGPGGKNIKEICEKTGSTIDIEDDGTVYIASKNSVIAEETIAMVNSITSEPEYHKVYQGKVIKILEFGAVVSFMGTKEGLVHISEISDQRVETVEDALKLDDMVDVVVTEMDERKSRIRLSIKKAANPADYTPATSEGSRGGERRSSGGDRDRGGRSGGFGDRPRGGDRGGRSGGFERRSSGGGYGDRPAFGGDRERRGPPSDRGGERRSSSFGDRDRGGERRGPPSDRGERRSSDRGPSEYRGRSSSGFGGGDRAPSSDRGGERRSSSDRGDRRGPPRGRTSEHPGSEGPKKFFAL